MVAAAASGLPSRTARIVSVLARGVVTHSSRADATQARPSGMDASAAHGPRCKVRRSKAHTLSSPRLPTHTTPSPTVAELGPILGRPGRDDGFVANPPSGVTLPVATSTTSTLPVLPAGTQTLPLVGSYAR